MSPFALDYGSGPRPNIAIAGAGSSRIVPARGRMERMDETIIALALAVSLPPGSEERRALLRDLRASHAPAVIERCKAELRAAGLSSVNLP